MVLQLFNVLTMTLGHNIKALRVARGWTYEQLSDASGVEVGTIHALEKRSSLRSKYAAALAKALACPLETLLGDCIATPARNIVEEPAATYSVFRDHWPFESIPRERFERLTERQKGAVETAMRQAMTAEEMATASVHEPSKKRGSTGR